jgi:hypothetical protein
LRWQEVVLTDYPKTIAPLTRLQRQLEFSDRVRARRIFGDGDVNLVTLRCADTQIDRIDWISVTMRFTLGGASRIAPHFTAERLNHSSDASSETTQQLLSSSAARSSAAGGSRRAASPRLRLQGSGAPSGILLPARFP